MNDSFSPAPPAWVHKRDGQLVPFDADKISRSLFAAAESLGCPDAFLARELADGVVHFLCAENEGTTPTTDEIAELVIKVVRELGQPALSEAFARSRARREAEPQTRQTPQAAEIVLPLTPETTLPALLASCTQNYTLQNVFARDLVSARDAGLLALTGLESPAELAGCVLTPPLDPASGLIATLEELRRFVARFVVFDGPEHLLAAHGQPSADDFARDVVAGLRLTRLHGIVNLNSAAPPSWAGILASGPLFAVHQRAPHTEQLHELADELLRAFLHPAHSIPCAGAVRIDWHLGEGDFAAEPAKRERLQRLARLAVQDAPLSFVFDRPRRPPPLAEGVNRQHPAALLTVGLHLPRLAMQAGIDGDSGKFLAKLGSLARLALSAGVQKREYLRRLERARPNPSGDGPALTSGFLLDRARLVVAPVGLDYVVHSFLGKGLSGSAAALDLARQIVMRLRDVLRQDGRNVHLDTCLDGPFAFRLAEANDSPDEWPNAEQAAGLTAWDATAALKSQWRSASILQGVAEHGTLALFLPDDPMPPPEQVADWLSKIWRQSDVVRVRFVRGTMSARQLTFSSKESKDE